MKNSKRFGIYLLIGLYSYLLLKPIAPIVSDFISHTFNEFEHVATIHFEHGKYHLHADLVSADQKQTHHSENQNNKQTTENRDLHYFSNQGGTDCNTLLLQNQNKEKRFFPFKKFIPETVVSTNYPPPEIS